MRWSVYDGLAIVIVGSALFLVAVVSWWKSVVVGEWNGGD